VKGLCRVNHCVDVKGFDGDVERERRREGGVCKGLSCVFFNVNSGERRRSVSVVIKIKK
jgi:hypothetical protein